MTFPLAVGSPQPIPASAGPQTAAQVAAAIATQHAADDTRYVVKLQATGAADESAAILAALTAMDPQTGGRLVLSGVFKAANIVIPNRQNIVIDMAAAIIQKNANGPVFTTPSAGWGKHLTFVLPHIDCQGATFTGGGIAVGASSAFFATQQGYIIDATTAPLDFSAGGDGAGSQCDVDGTLLTVYQGQNGQANAATSSVKLPLDATQSANRGFRGVRTDNCLLVEDAGSQNTRFVDCEARNINLTGDPRKLILKDTRLASVGADILLRGVQCVVEGNTLGGSLKPGNAMANSTIADNVIAGDFILDSTTVGNECSGNRPSTGLTRDDGSNYIEGHEWGFPYTVPMGVDTNAGAVTANRTLYMRVHESGLITKIGLQFAASSGLVCVSVYRKSGAGQLAVPGTQAATSGGVACPAIGYAEIAAAAEVRSGDFFGYEQDNGTASVTHTSPSPSFTNLAKGQSYLEDGAFPSPAAATPSAARIPIVAMVGVA